MTMHSEPRHLVTTADERTWKFGRPVLFLGEWCRRYRRREVWGRMDAIVAEPYGAAPAQKDRDYAYVTQLSAGLLVELAELLNRHHGVTNDMRYWRILLGHWLYRCVAVLFNRWYSLGDAAGRYRISQTTVLASSGYALATADSMTFIWACSDDVWNQALFARILRAQNTIVVEETSTALSAAPWFVHGLGKRGVGLQPSLGERLMLALSRDTDAFIISPYLPRNMLVKLLLLLGQVPQRWVSPQAPAVLPDAELRMKFALADSGKDAFERFLRATLPELLPTCFLEGYAGLQRQAAQLPWPRKPRFIYTGNNFDTDEVFKVWAAAKATSGTPYYTAQHGMNYGSLDYCYTESECVATSDKFLTWGWSDGATKHVPAFMFKTADKKRAPRTDPGGGLLLIELRPRHRIDPWDIESEYGQFQEEQFKFAESLPPAIGEKLLVRLHGGHMQNNWFDADRWRDRHPRIKVDGGATPLSSLIAASRLIVHSYSSTGMAETLSYNIPTLCFWHPGLLAPLRASARPYYEKLRQAGIFFDSPEQAAAQAARVWLDVASWWGSDAVQSARSEFCERFARSVANPLRYLKSALLQPGPTAAGARR